jgi:hypothetical protein
MNIKDEKYTGGDHFTENAVSVGKNERLLNLKNGVWTPFLKNFTKKIKKLLRLSEFSV